MVHLFLDDSGKEGQETNPFVCMAGYFGDRGTLTDLNNKWVQLLLKHEIQEIHMKDLIPLAGEYKKREWDYAKRDAVLAEFIDVIRETRMVGVGIAVDVAAWKAFKRAHPELFKIDANAQQFCLERVLRRVVDRLHAANVNDELSLVFDTDPEFGANRLRLFAALMEHDQRAAYRLTSITFGHPVYFPGLQCADMLVWETRKELIQKSLGHKSTRRWDAIFAKMPEYELDYIGERWDEAEFDRILPQLIEISEAMKAKGQKPLA